MNCSAHIFFSVHIEIKKKDRYKCAFDFLKAALRTPALEVCMNAFKRPNESFIKKKGARHSAQFRMNVSECCISARIDN